MSAVQMVESPGCQSEAFTKQSHNVVDFPTTDKGLAILKAKFAMAGHQVHDGDTGDFLVTRWGMSRWCEDVDSLQAFARLLGVMHG